VKRHCLKTAQNVCDSVHEAYSLTWEERVEVPESQVIAIGFGFQEMMMRTMSLFQGWRAGTKRAGRKACFQLLRNLAFQRDFSSSGLHFEATSGEQRGAEAENLKGKTGCNGTTVLEPETCRCGSESVETSRRFAFAGKADALPNRVSGEVQWKND
jgi:uncharacterized protein YbdZ (MbtH family)